MLAAAIFFLVFALLLGAALGPGASVLVLLVFVLPTLAAWWNQSQAKFRRIFTKNEGLQSFVQGSFDENGLTYGVNHAPWTSVQRVQANEIVAVISAPHMFIVPRSFFDSAEAWTAFLRLAQAHVPQQPSVMTRSLKSALIWVAVLLAVFAVWLLTQG
jgi:hypothetical protein